MTPDPGLAEALRAVVDKIDAAVRERAAAALDYYVGNKAPLLANLETVCQAIEESGEGVKTSGGL
jgi:hypothetical protein